MNYPIVMILCKKRHLPEYCGEYIQIALFHLYNRPSQSFIYQSSSQYASTLSSDKPIGALVSLKP